MDKTFGPIDYILFAITLLASAGVGLFYAIRSMRDKQTTKQILLGGGNMPIFPTALSLLTSFLSGVSLLALPAETYQRGALFWLSRVVATPISVGLAMLVVLPLFWTFKPTSVYEYLERRFGSVMLRSCGSVLYLIYMASYMAIVLYAPAIALSGITGVPAWVFFISVGLICNIYTSLGGLMAVVWTDTLQAVFMVTGLLALFFKGCVDVGGVAKTFTIAANYSRFDGLTNFDMNPMQYMTVWTSVFGGIGFWFSLLTFNQISVQRYLSLSTLADAEKVLAINIPGYVIFCTLSDLLGCVIFAYYLGCDPINTGKVESRDQLVIHYSLDVLSGYKGLPGIFLACLFSGTLSTISSGINSMAAVTWEDFLIRRYGTLDPKRQSLIVKIIAFCYGFLAIALSFAAGPLGGILKACLSVMGSIGGPLVGLFMLGIFIPQANKYGALMGLVVSILITLWISIGNAVHKPYKPYQLRTPTDKCEIQNFTHKTITHNPYNPMTGINTIYGLSPNLYALVGLLLLIIVAVPVSLLMKDKDMPSEEVHRYTVYGLYGKQRHQISPEKHAIKEEERKGTTKRESGF